MQSILMTWYIYIMYKGVLQLFFHVFPLGDPLFHPSSSIKSYHNRNGPFMRFCPSRGGRLRRNLFWRQPVITVIVSLRLGFLCLLFLTPVWRWCFFFDGNLRVLLTTMIPQDGQDGLICWGWWHWGGSLRFTWLLYGGIWSHFVYTSAALEVYQLRMSKQDFHVRLLDYRFLYRCFWSCQISSRCNCTQCSAEFTCLGFLTPFFGGAKDSICGPATWKNTPRLFDDAT